MIVVNINDSLVRFDEISGKAWLLVGLQGITPAWIEVAEPRGSEKK